MRATQSTLTQRGSRDEVVVVDDWSCDETCSTVRVVDDGRIRPRQDAANFGAVQTFERALGLPRARSVPLADQGRMTRAAAQKDACRRGGVRCGRERLSSAVPTTGGCSQWAESSVLDGDHRVGPYAACGH
jgi:hypothetical protein